MENKNWKDLFEFDDVGKEIKQWAKWIAWILFITSTIVGIGMIVASVVMLFDSFDGIVWLSLFFGGMIEIVFGYIVARLEVILLYGFGELIDQTMQINHRQLRQEHTAEKKEVGKDKVKAVMTPRPAKQHTWRCPTCDRLIDKEPCQYCFPKQAEEQPAEDKPSNQHKWRCPTCNRMIQESPCPYCEPMWDDVVPVERTEQSWICPKCGTKNLNSRTDCWRCDYKI